MDIELQTLIWDLEMELIVIGSGTGLPSLSRASPGMVVKANDKIFLFDSGSGTLMGLLRAGITYKDLDYLFYSHLHPDHTLDLVSILFAAKNPQDPRKKDLFIIAPKGFRDFYNGLLKNFGDSIKPESYMVRLNEVGDSQIEYDGWQLIAKPLVHTQTSIGYRIEFVDGKSIVYSGDTDYCKNLVELARDVELLILECSFPDGQRVEGHLTPSSAGRIAVESGSRRLLLTHLYPVCEGHDILSQCREVFKGEIILAKDLMRLEV